MASVPDLSALTILIYDRAAETYARLLRGHGFPGRLIPCQTAAEAAANLAATDVLFAGPFPVDLVQRAPRLQWVQSLWAGVEGWIDSPLPAAVPLTRMVRVFGPRIAEYVLGHLLALDLGVDRLRAQQAARQWLPFRTGSLRGKVMGIAGTGDIGGAIAQRALAFDMTVHALSRSGRPLPGAARTFTPAELELFLAALDVLVLVLPLTAETRAMFGAAQLHRLPRGSRLVNVGRGAVVDEAALAGALHSRHLEAAVLDVFMDEPLPADSPLWDAPGCIITPHVAGPSVPAEVAEACWENLQRFARGDALLGLVDRQRGY